MGVVGTVCVCARVRVRVRVCVCVRVRLCVCACVTLCHTTSVVASAGVVCNGTAGTHSLIHTI